MINSKKTKILKLLFLINICFFLIYVIYAFTTNSEIFTYDFIILTCISLFLILTIGYNLKKIKSKD
ncbi:hypothetical protein GCM10007140_39230 [Priestia taiwanensis]|uniref:Uncharacterized protein n=1 Tax=Priestia taiwanensis TaxID=1347902 RepID=A0A917EUC6_9BACI|nr:hypothetical protein GCM10007140_39230 [Priestia taiwanensis]